MPKNIIDFLFAESFQPDADEVIAEVVERMAEIEGLEVRKQPLEKALKELDLGFPIEVQVDAKGAFVKFEDDCQYSAVAEKLKSAESIIKLAELGWVPAFNNDTRTSGDAPCFSITFIDVSEVETSDSDKVPDLEKLVQGMADDQDEGHPEGLGADLKIPSAETKGAKVPAAPKPKSAIKDSYTEPFDVVVAAYHRLEETTRDKVRAAAVASLKETGFGDLTLSDINQSVVRLYREHGDWEAVAAAAPSL